ncbi:ABC transporter ATP-binding protein [Phytoactinopolyspora limicola]|uniref:ABC transporter ATP-binding protein n=1 Tax=Phytoactinopolyspora limicola TaxID=2715536 RepID=UPI00140D9240|nr:ABC transporter ATP-binding protein [Phytoactinopolyspora limicola]
MATINDTEKADAPRIVLSGVGKWFDDLCVFQGVDLDVGKNEIISIVGPSGCGKTSLLRCLNGLLKPDQGQVLVDGEPVLGPRKSIAMVFQDFGLFPWKTVLGNVGYGLKVRGVPKSEIRDVAQHFIKLVGLEGREHAYPFQLSGGMQQRAGLARALTVNPNVLLMDEPFGSLDAQTRELLQFELLNIWSENPTTMVFVTHAIEEAVLLGDRVVVMMGRPSSIRTIVDVPLPRPRDPSTIASAEFQQIRHYVWELVMGVERGRSDGAAHVG